MATTAPRRRVIIPSSDRGAAREKSLGQMLAGLKGRLEQQKNEPKKIEIVSLQIDSPVAAGRKCTAVIRDVSQETTILDLKKRVSQDYSIPIQHQTFFSLPKAPRLAAVSEEKAEPDSSSVRRVCKDSETLGAVGVRLGWTSGTLVAHGDTLDVQTLLPIADYYPGGRQWSEGAGSSTAGRSHSMSTALLLLLGGLLAFSTLLSVLTS